MKKNKEINKNDKNISNLNNQKVSPTPVLDPNRVIKSDNTIMSNNVSPVNNMEAPIVNNQPLNNNIQESVVIRKKNNTWLVLLAALTIITLVVATVVVLVELLDVTKSGTDINDILTNEDLEHVSTYSVSKDSPVAWESSFVNSVYKTINDEDGISIDKADIIVDFDLVDYDNIGEYQTLITVNKTNDISGTYVSNVDVVEQNSNDLSKINFDSIFQPRTNQSDEYQIPYVTDDPQSVIDYYNDEVTKKIKELTGDNSITQNDFSLNFHNNNADGNENTLDFSSGYFANNVTIKATSSKLTGSQKIVIDYAHRYNLDDVNLWYSQDTGAGYDKGRPESGHIREDKDKDYNYATLYLSSGDVFGSRIHIESVLREVGCDLLRSYVFFSAPEGSIPTLPSPILPSMNELQTMDIEDFNVILCQYFLVEWPSGNTKKEWGVSDENWKGITVHAAPSSPVFQGDFVLHLNFPF